MKAVTAAFLLFVFPLSLPAETTNTASVVANSRSLEMAVFSGYVPGVGTTYNYVTTYDGETDFPLYQPLPNDYILYSLELRPRVGSSSVYEADFVTYDSDYYEIDLAASPRISRPAIQMETVCRMLRRRTNQATRISAERWNLMSSEPCIR